MNHHAPGRGQDRDATHEDRAGLVAGPEATPPLPSPGGDNARDQGPTFEQIRGLLAERRQIAILWSADDVRAVRPDLDQDEAWKVLQQVEQRHDGDRGVTWDTIETASQELFFDPDPFVTAGSHCRPQADGPADRPRLPTPGEIVANPKAYLAEQSGGDGHDHDRER